MELRESFLFRLECDPPAYLWSGVGDMIVDGDTYLGGGELLSGLPEIQQLINGTASRVDFSVSGVDAATVRLAHEDRQSVNGALVRIGTVPMDVNWQIIGPVDWEWEGVADVVNIDRSASENGEVTRTISVSVGSADTARSRNQLTLFTNADQRRRSPDDAFFSHVGGITAGTSRRFEATT